MCCAVVFPVVLATALIGSVIAVEPPNSDTEASCFRDTKCSQQIEFQSIRDCCVNDPNGASFNIPGTEICSICVVFGWRELTNNRMLERDQRYDFEVAYIKPGTTRTSTVTVFNVTDREGTARRGPDKDYILNTASVSISPDTPAIVNVVFRVDRLALEPPETLQLILEPQSPQSGDGIFCITDLDLVIKDADVVDLGFSEADYIANEQDETVEVTVVKNSRIATDLILTVSPVTSSVARDLGQFPQGVDLPGDNDGHSPIDADLKDFNSTVQIVTFAADEFDEEPNDETVLQIGVIDDEINEAMEENFVVIINVTDTINAERTRVSRPSSICRIIDNDLVVIGFLSTTVMTVEGSNNWLNFSIGVTQGYLYIHMTINFTTEDVTAQAGSDYQKTTTSLVFVGDSTLSILVKVFDDEMHESPEVLYGHLSVDSTPSPNIQLKPDRAKAIIVDNEEETSETTEAVIVTGVVISAGIITFVTAAMVIACVVLRKKCGKKVQQQASPEHTYESIPLPTKGSQFGHGVQEEPDRTTSVSSHDEPVKYDDLVSSKNVQVSCSDIPLRANKAYNSFQYLS